MFNSFNTTSSPISYNYINDHLNPNSNLLEDLSYCSSYYHLPSPFIYNEINNLGDFIGHPELTSIQEGGLEANDSLIIDDSTMFRETNKADSNKGTMETINEIVLEDGGNYNLIGLGVCHGSRRRRHSKGDRHSKIRTAHGLRDRRMRLSLKVAGPFFKLQDMLGYDQASRTVEWLLIQAKSAIQEQLQSKYGSISTAVITSSSDYEVQSIIIEKESLKEKNPKGNKSSTCVKKDIDKPKVMRKKGTTKESRKEARDRARKRTLERMQCQRHDNNHKLPSTCSTWRSFEMVENSNVSNSQIHPSKTPIQIEDHVAASLLSEWSPLTIFHWPQNGEISLNVPSYRISIQPNTMGDQQ